MINFKQNDQLDDHWIEYRCRRCSEVFRPMSINYLSESLKCPPLNWDMLREALERAATCPGQLHALDPPSTWVHDCREGVMGVGDVIGLVEVKEHEE